MDLKITLSLSGISTTAEKNYLPVLPRNFRAGYDPLLMQIQDHHGFLWDNGKQGFVAL